MNKDRRAFLRNTSLATGLLLLQQPFRSLAAITNNAMYLPGTDRELLIWHTNNLHGKVIKHSNILAQGILVDAGDFLDKTADNLEHKATIEQMNRSGYHVATIGNHELANGQTALATLIPYMRFALVNCNYQFSDKVLNSKILPYKIVYVGAVKVGITGVGPLLPVESGIVSRSPVDAANETAMRLKKEQGCDVVICLSHLGYKQGDTNNHEIATGSEHIDLVIGDQRQKPMHSMHVLHNANNHEVYISQAGYNGSATGFLKIKFDEDRAKCGIEPGWVMA